MTTPGEKDGLTPAARKILPLAIKWANYWKVPPSFVMAICEIESSFRPDAQNSYAVNQGGAWGLMQVTKTTADTLVKRLDASIVPALGAGAGAGGKVVITEAPLHRQLIWAKWKASDARCLLDADLNVMLGTYYLGRFCGEFGRDLGKVAAAYHNGAGFLRLFLARDKKNLFPGDMPPKGKLYVTKALAARAKYGDEDDTPRPVLVANNASAEKAKTKT